MAKKIAATMAVAMVLLLTAITHGTMVVRVQAQEADPEAILGQLVDTVNAGDVEGALALFTEDATFVRGGRCPPGACSGTDAIRGELEKDVADNHQLEIVSTEVSDGTLTARIELRTDATRAAGIERMIQVFTLEFADDKIAALQARPDFTDPKTAAFREATQQQLPTTGSGPASGGGMPAPLRAALGLLIAGALMTTLAIGTRSLARG